MDTKNMTMMIISLVISVVLVAGLMVPVISSLGNSGGGSGYANTGEYYYKTPVAGETHTIRIDAPTGDGDYPAGAVTNPNMIVTFDGEVLITADTNEGFAIPLWVKDNYDLCAFYNSTTLWWPAGPYVAPSGALPEAGIYVGQSYYSSIGFNMSYNDYVICEIDGATVNMAYYENGHETPIVKEPFEVKALITPDTTGDYVYSMNPIVMEDTEIYNINEYFELKLRTDTERGVFRNVTFWGMGTLETLETSIEYLDGDYAMSPFGEPGTPDYEGWYWEDWVDSIDVTSINTTQTENGIRLDSISIDTIWEDENEELYTVPVEVSGFIVPVQIGGSGGSGSDISPTLLSLISVIPLITVIGIVIGAVGYLRMKN